MRASTGLVAAQIRPADCKQAPEGAENKKLELLGMAFGGIPHFDK
ncbi:hypothetical protein [Microbulbifer pacificus]|nr:hypothetical protein [Microbulbifer pacificus]